MKSQSHVTSNYLNIFRVSCAYLEALEIYISTIVHTVVHKVGCANISLKEIIPLRCEVIISFKCIADEYRCNKNLLCIKQTLTSDLQILVRRGYVIFLNDFVYFAVQLNIITNNIILHTTLMIPYNKFCSKSICINGPEYKPIND
ncbi:hypothetical protein V1477_011591 [Vespula maculifrons]|uniref:Uncharacterized protein n=1 Tax=Vespula maculifrons TaxID=7453 RepID=A0ABD2BZM9_VESMC